MNRKRGSVWLVLCLVMAACGGAGNDANLSETVPSGAETTSSSAQKTEPSTATSTSSISSVATTTPLDGSTTTSSAAAATTTSTTAATTTTVAPTTTATTSVDVGPSTVPPDWLGTIALPLRSDGYGEVQATPTELIDRQFPPPWFLRSGGSSFESSIGPIPGDVLARATWEEGCPVGLDELSYLTVSFIGFDGGSYIGEVIVNAQYAEAMVGVFRAMFDARFPLEEVRVVAKWELDVPPTGDGNITTAFVCRAVAGGTSWSQHAYGLAIDINSFHNPYVKGDLVLPELASFYMDRSLGLAGMIVEGDPVVRAFDGLGWGWGGRWNSLTDPQHFSANNR